MLQELWRFPSEFTVLCWILIIIVTAFIMDASCCTPARKFDEPKSFTKEFIFGAASAAYQIEGAWNEDGRGESIWDRLVHTRPELVNNGETGDTACDSYHLFRDDINLIKDIGFDMYRFSISWPRILPDGDITRVNSVGVEYYHNVIDELLKKGIQPMVTIYHWDLPQKLQEMGGWLNPLIVDYIEDYANLLFKLYGNKVKWWITINEPIMVVRGYSRKDFAPALDTNSPGDYIVAHNLIKAHARIFRLYEREYEALQRGKLSIAINSRYFEAKTNSPADLEATKRAWTFALDWFAHPIYSASGDYPELMRKIVDENSRQEKRNRSRLPKFTAEEIESIKGSFHYFALNHYSSTLCAEGKPPYEDLLSKDANVTYVNDPSWPETLTPIPVFRVVPHGMREILRYIKDQYGNVPIFITENGYCGDARLNDTERISFHREYLLETAKAMKEYGCNVIGYLVWAIIDNFEWLNGYKCRFGLIHVDFDNVQKKRTPRSSAQFFKQLVNSRSIPELQSF